MISVSPTLKDQKRLFEHELILLSVWLILSRIFLQPFRNAYLRRIEILFDKTCIIALGFQEASRNYTQREAFEHLTVIKTTIVKFNSFRNRLEEVEFLGVMK
jgi:hypothetical protein